MLQPLLATANIPLTRLSHHKHACNYQTDDGAIIALVTPQHGNGPFHIVLPEPLPLILADKDGVSGQWRQETLHIGPLQIDLHRAQVWQPDLPILHHLRPDASRRLHEETDQYPPSTLQSGATAQHMRARQGMDALQKGFIERDHDQVRAGVLYLAGLGPGLTPAGDDFLVGLLAAFHAGHLQRVEEQINRCRLIAQTAAAQTTKLSAQWLRCAGQGHFGEAWHHLIIALNDDSATAISRAAHRILTAGATSGVDAMSGFLFGIRLLEDGGERSEDRSQKDRFLSSDFCLLSSN